MQTAKVSEIDFDEVSQVYIGIGPAPSSRVLVIYELQDGSVFEFRKNRLRPHYVDRHKSLEDLKKLYNEFLGDNALEVYSIDIKNVV